MDSLRIVQVPRPIGEFFHHRHVNGTTEHHETKWIKDFAHCEKCGIAAEVSFTPLELFLRDEVLMNQLCQ